MILLALALGAAATRGDTVEADLRCVAYLSGAINAAPADQQPGLAAGILYFVGRIDARRPGFDYRAALAPGRARAARLAHLERDAPRCVATIAERGRAIVAAGQKGR